MEAARWSLTEVVRAGAGGAEPSGGAAEPAAAGSGPSMADVTIPYEDRRRSRMLVRLSDGREAALQLPRGTVLRAGDLLTNPERRILVRVRAANETLSVAITDDPLLLARAAYHLGNRHVPLQIAPGRVSFQHDHVLDGLVRDLGLSVRVESLPFEPEAGGYRHAGSEPGPNRARAHEHEHEHPHAHELPHAHAHAHEHEHEHAHGLEHAHEHEHALAPRSEPAPHAGRPAPVDVPSAHDPDHPHSRGRR
jgi:urease accessory protein